MGWGKWWMWRRDEDSEGGTVAVVCARTAHGCHLQDPSFNGLVPVGLFVVGQDRAQDAESPQGSGVDRAGLFPDVLLRADSGYVDRDHGMVELVGAAVCGGLVVDACARRSYLDLVDLAGPLPGVWRKHGEQCLAEAESVLGVGR